MVSKTIGLPAGQKLSVTADAVSNGTVVLLNDGVPQSPVTLAASQTKTFGPYGSFKNFLIESDQTLFATAVSSADPADYLSQLHASGDGAPVNAVQATLNFNPAGDENGVTLTAKEYGAGGNGISIRYVDPGANNAALSVLVQGQTISVNLATGAGGAITSTAAAVIAAINADPKASALVTASIYAGDTGSADDGSGVVTAKARASLTGGAGSGLNVVLPGGLYSDTTNANIYRNSGTLAAPVWTQLADHA